MSIEIAHPRPTLSEEELAKGPRGKRRRLQIGTRQSGVILDITEKGVEANGYYEGFRPDGPKYKNVREPIFISWEDIEKEREKLKPKRKRRLKPDRVEREIDQEYLNTLPIVTINKTRHYIDADRRERRSVDNPNKVYKF